MNPLRMAQVGMKYDRSFAARGRGCAATTTRGAACRNGVAVLDVESGESLCSTHGSRRAEDRWAERDVAWLRDSEFRVVLSGDWVHVRDERGDLVVEGRIGVDGVVFQLLSGIDRLLDEQATRCLVRDYPGQMAVLQAG